MGRKLVVSLQGVVQVAKNTWQRLPVARNYRLLRAERLKPVLPKTEVQDESKPRSVENNPFRNYKIEPLSLPPSQGEDFFEGSPANLGQSDDIDDHALLQHWIDDRLEEPSAGLLSNSNRSPVVSASSFELAKVLERYCRMMGAIPSLALERSMFFAANDIFQSVVQLMEFYVHCVLCLFDPHQYLSLGWVRFRLEPTEEWAMMGEMWLERIVKEPMEGLDLDAEYYQTAR
eukprot:g23235.t1